MYRLFIMTDFLNLFSLVIANFFDEMGENKNPPHQMQRIL